MKKIVLIIISLLLGASLINPANTNAQDCGVLGKACCFDSEAAVGACRDGKSFCQGSTCIAIPQESFSRQGTSAINGGCGTDAIDTAVGCVPINSSNDLIGFILRWGVGIGGGIAFILILIAGFQIITSRGDPKQLQAGQELLTSAIAGLLMLIFSVIILRIIGVDILGIKELGGGTTGLP